MTAARFDEELRLPDPVALFDARARRFAALAEQNPAGPFLELLSRVAGGQHAAALRLRVPAGPVLLDGAPLDHRRAHPQPVWRDMLREVLAAAEGPGLPAPAIDAIARLRGAPDDALDAAAAGALRQPPSDLATAPFVAAALQVQYAILCAKLAPELLARGGSSCPACGAAPVAGTISRRDRVRHVWCSLCGLGWHVTRAQCTRCASAAELSYFSLADAMPGVQAEACDTCGTYLKIFDLQERGEADPLADDAATLVLDVLMNEHGYARGGTNLVAPSGLAQ